MCVYNLQRACFTTLYIYIHIYIYIYIYIYPLSVTADCQLREGSQKYTFILGTIEMKCAPATVFNLTLCTCVHDPDVRE